MRLTPLDIQGHRFSRRFNGVDPDEVEAFLRTVSDDYESLLRESQRTTDELRQVQKRVEELASSEKLLQETLLTAQSMGEDIRHSAVRESEVLIREAEVQGEKILDAAHRRASKLAEDIREMKALRTRLAAAIRSSIETHLALVDALSEDVDEDPMIDGKVTYLGAANRARGERDAEPGTPAAGIRDVSDELEFVEAAGDAARRDAVPRREAVPPRDASKPPG